MSHIRAVHELRRFTHPTDADFVSALHLYARLIPGISRTNSNEIVFWLEHYSQFTPDQFCVFGFYNNDEIIGYAQCVYFQQEKLVVFDYMVLHEAHRSHGEYFQFVQLLNKWLDQQHWEIDYIATEVAKETSITEPSRTPLLVELFKQVGFLVVHCVYFQPQLGVHNEQSDIPAYLLVRSGQPDSSIASPVFLKIVSTIYFKHYERWYQPFIDSKKEYNGLLVKRFKEVQAVAEQSDRIEMDGIKFIVPTLAPPAPRRASKFNQIIGSACAASLVLLTCFCLLSFRHIFNEDLMTVLSCLSASLVVSFAVFALFYKKGQSILTQLLQHAKSSDKKRLR